ncbi:tripartite tricarboxylate transporter substrate binding protein (plasmid) [Variovorax sp. V213]|uniref:Bug family tripartite tricarboxylate transporter substrate binding protein n=1 Tax=Variovorax sp. V213 TaxID=3065955 RepID=UPI0034E8CA3D
MIKFFRSIIATVALTIVTFTAMSQGINGRTSTFVVPYPAGGPSDFVARTIQTDLTKHLGQQVVIDNVGGAGGAIGIQKVLQTRTDGSAFVLASPSDLILAPLFVSAIKYKPEDLRLAGLVMNSSLALLVRPTIDAKNLDELLAKARQPGAKELSFGSSGVGSLYHLAGEVFAKKAGIKMLHVPYKGGAPLIADLMGGQIDMTFLPLAGNIPELIKSKKVLMLGVAAVAQHPMFPDAPALAAMKPFDGFVFDVWAGVLVPKKTPDSAVQKLNEAISASTSNVEVRRAFEATGSMAGKQMSVQELEKFYASDIARYQGIVKAANIPTQ